MTQVVEKREVKEKENEMSRVYGVYEMEKVVQYWMRMSRTNSNTNTNRNKEVKYIPLDLVKIVHEYIREVLIILDMFCKEYKDWIEFETNTKNGEYFVKCGTNVKGGHRKTTSFRVACGLCIASNACEYML